MEPELDFNDIVSGKDQAPKITEKKVAITETDTRARQQSCMIKDVDKDLVPPTNLAPIQHEGHHLKF